MDVNELMKKLQEPFEPSDIEWRVGSTNKEKTKGLALAYITNRAIQNRLDEVFGIAGWKNEFKDWKGSGVLCGISCLINGEWITKWDGAEETRMEATKGGLSDAMKRAGYQWGVGRYLYKLESVWVDIENFGSSSRIKKGCEPKLPTWALPEGYKPSEAPKQASQGKPSPTTINQSQNGNKTGTQMIKASDLICKAPGCGKTITEAAYIYSTKNLKLDGGYCPGKCQNEAKKAQ